MYEFILEGTLVGKLINIVLMAGAIISFSLWIHLIWFDSDKYASFLKMRAKSFSPFWNPFRDRAIEFIGTPSWLTRLKVISVFIALLGLFIAAALVYTVVELILTF